MKKLITIKKFSLAFTFIFICNSVFSQTVIDNENFEGGVFAGTIWNDGGSDCRIINSVPPNGNYSLELTDGSSGNNTSSYTNALDLSTYTSVHVTFDFQTSGFVGTDDFYLEYSIDGGTNYIKIGDYNIDASGTQFTDGTQYLAENIILPTNAAFSSTIFRFRSSATSGPNELDILYIDNVIITGYINTDTILDISVNASSDDAEEDVIGGAMDLTSSDLEICDDGGTNQYVGVRFDNVTIPPGSTINTSYIQFSSDDDDTAPLTITITGIDADDTTTFTTTNYNISDRIDGDITSGTTANATWNPASWNNDDILAAQRTPSLNAIVQEIVDRGGWSLGNAMGFVLSSPSTDERRTDTWNHDPNLAPTLHVEFTLPPPTPTVEEIPAGANWRYLDDGSDQGTAWTASAFDDSSWSYGIAELGYGNSPITTIGFGPDPDNKYVTTYFRKEFTIADHTAWNSLDLEAIRDDGMVVYLNGVEVWRDHITGTVDYTTFADTPAIGGSDEKTWITKNIPTTGLITGTNVIAVEIHQVNLTSSDLGFNFKLTPSTSVANPLPRGPYLQSGTSTSVIVKWRTDTATESVVKYGTSVAALNTTVSDNTLKTEHELTLSSLSPNTTYYYSIGDNTTTFIPGSSSYFYKTAPTIGTDQFVRAWILGDPGTSGNGTYGNDQQDVRDAYYAYVDETGPTGSITNPNQTDMVLFLGDNAYNNGTDSEYQAGFFDVYDDILKNTVAWSCLGNHDSYSVDFNTQSGPYYDIFSFPTAAEVGGTASGTEEYYSFDYANIHFIVLQSENVDGGGNEPAFNTAQKAWLTTDINATTQDWIVTFFHHPPYTKGSHDSDNAGENGIFTMREQYIPILEAGGVDLILSGHSHSYERSKFVKGHTGLSGTFNPAQTTSGGHTVGANGNLSGRADTGDLAYAKTDTDLDGAVYITAGSSGKATGAQFNGQDPYTGANTLPVMYYSAQSLGSTILEIEDDGSGGQNMNIKFLRDTGVIDDYFTINKSGVTLSTESNDFSDRIKVFPVPANSLLNIDVNQGENLKNIKIFDALGKVVKETPNKQINVSSLNAGLYIVQITTDKNEYFKNIIIK